jgi:hypothetical protein
MAMLFEFHFFGSIQFEIGIQKPLAVLTADELVV